VFGTARKENYTSPIGLGNSSGLQASLTHTMSHWWSVRAAYTDSHSLDHTPEELENGRN